MGKKLKRSVVVEGLLYGPGSENGDELPDSVKSDNPKLYLSDDEVAEQREKEAEERRERVRKQREAAAEADDEQPAKPAARSGARGK